MLPQLHMLVTSRFFGKKFARNTKKIVSKKRGSREQILMTGRFVTPFNVRGSTNNPNHNYMDPKASNQSGQTVVLAEQNHNCNPPAKWAALVEDKFVPAPQRRVEVQMLKAQASIPAGNILVRDLGGEHDVPLNDNQMIDLAEGNVFYAVPACDAPKPTGHHAPPKLAFFVDDRPEETLRADQTGLTLRELFGFAPEVHLFRDYESPNDKPIGLNDPVGFADGPVFYTRRQPHVITIKINNTDYEVHEHVMSVKELKKLAGISLADVLVKIANNEMKQLDDNGTVELHCGDVFVSHPRDNASS